MTTLQMLEKIRDIIAQCDVPEEDVYSALVGESFGWRMRLEELEHEEEDDEF